MRKGDNVILYWGAGAQICSRRVLMIQSRFNLRRLPAGHRPRPVADRARGMTHSMYKVIIIIIICTLHARTYDKLSYRPLNTSVVHKYDGSFGGANVSYTLGHLQRPITVNATHWSKGPAILKQARPIIISCQTSHTSYKLYGVR